MTSLHFHTLTCCRVLLDIRWLPALFQRPQTDWVLRVHTSKDVRIKGVDITLQEIVDVVRTLLSSWGMINM